MNNIYLNLIETGKYSVSEQNQYSLRMSEKIFPVSISSYEFDFIRNFIVNNNFRSGFEIATGFGISSLALALGFKETDGHLVTIDAYIEESQGTSYYDAELTKNSNPLGFQSVNYLIERFGLKDVLYAKIGLSPSDVPKFLPKEIDVAFLDGLHTNDQIVLDFDAVYSALNKEKFVVFIHDTHCLSGSILSNFESRLNAKLIVPEHLHGHRLGHNLGYISKL